jgi:hypothetical protein
MAGTFHARRSSHTGVIAVLLVGFFVVLTAAALVFTSRGSGDSPSAPTPVVRAVTGRGSRRARGTGTVGTASRSATVPVVYASQQPRLAEPRGSAVVAPQPVVVQ